MMNKVPSARIDHLLTYVDDLDDAAKLFTRMGFLLSPVSHIEPMGISNRMILMRPQSDGQANYVELMSPHDRSKLPAAISQLMAGDPGIGSLVLVADDLDAFHRKVVRLGFDAPPPAHVLREWRIPGEPAVFPEFDVLMPVDGLLPFNACRYYNIQLYLRDDWVAHPNGAERVIRVYAIAERPADFDYFSDLLGRAGQRTADACRLFPSGDISLEILTPKEAEVRFGGICDTGREGYLGYEIVVESLDRLVGHLESGGIPFHPIGRSLCVAPDEALGNLIVFSES